MADRRIRPPRDKEAIILKLTKSDEPGSDGVFQTKAHLITFAAVYGFSRDRRVPIAQSEGSDAIRYEVFVRQGFDTVINLLALATTQDPRCLGDDEQSERLRIAVFEEYANGGLEELRTELQGVDDPLEHLLLMIQKDKAEDVGKDFDLSRFLE